MQIDRATLYILLKRVSAEINRTKNRHQKSVHARLD